MEYQLINPRDKTKSAIEQVLSNRGIKNIYHYLNTSESDILDPLLFSNMVEGAKLLISHIAQESKIMV